MSEPLETTPIEDLWDETTGFKSPDARQAVGEAEVIVGVDTISGRRFVVYGRNAAKYIAVNDIKPPPILSVSLNTDFGSHDLERLVAMVRAVKGRDEYKQALFDDRELSAPCSRRRRRHVRRQSEVKWPQSHSAPACGRYVRVPG